MSAKISFQDDYSYLAHPQILKALENASHQSHKTYGLDAHTAEAGNILREKMGRECDVHLIAGGTLTNLINLCHILKPYESIIACDSSHISVNETGAIEATGHKINTVQNQDGKITPTDIKIIINTHKSEHMVVPKVVYISQSTEKGTIYSLKELEDISSVCRENGLYLYIDGARMTSALASHDCDFTLSDIAKYCDMFYFGGTKAGAMFGEAVVIFNDNFKPYYRHSIKQHGGLLAKGAALGIQFQELFKDDLYLDLARHSNDMAMALIDAFRACGFTPDVPCQSNQIFITLPIELVETLQKDFEFLVWEKQETTATIRIVTAWSTLESDVAHFSEKLGLAAKK